jgi:hypothetical protein
MDAIVKVWAPAILCLALSCSLRAQTPTFVQSPATCHSTTTPLTCQFVNNVGANSSGNAIIVVAYSKNNTTFAVSDGASNTYSNITGSPFFNATLNNSMSFTTAPITAGGGTRIVVTVGFTGGAAQYEIAIAEVAGTVTAGSIVDVSNCAATTGASTTWNAPSLTTTNANDLVFAALDKDGNTATPTATAPFQLATSNSFFYQNILEYNGYSSTQSGLVPSAAITSSQTHIACDAAIKGPAGGAAAGFNKRKKLDKLGLS